MTNRQRLAATYLDVVGYDPFEDDPTITEAEVEATLREFEAEAAREMESAKNGGLYAF